MPPAKSRVLQAEDARAEGSTTRERQVAAAAHARRAKNNGASAANHGASLKDLALLSAEAGSANLSGQNTGMAWQDAPLSLLNAYRITHQLSAPAAFTSPLNQAILTNPGIGRQSPTMARKKEKRRISKEQLALLVRKNFNGAAVSEIDVVVELVYKIRHQDKAFRMRSAPGVTKKQ